MGVLTDGLDILKNFVLFNPLGYVDVYNEYIYISISTFVLYKS